MILWWIQLVHTTAIERWRAVHDILVGPISEHVHTGEMEWNGAMPQYFSLQGEHEPYPLEPLMQDLQPELGEHERIIFARMVQRDVIDRSAVEYFVVTRNMIATLSGQALIQRAIYLSRIAEEDLEKSQKSFDGHPDPS